MLSSQSQWPLSVDWKYANRDLFSVDASRKGQVENFHRILVHGILALPVAPAMKTLFGCLRSPRLRGSHVQALGSIPRNLADGLVRKLADHRSPGTLVADIVPLSFPVVRLVPAGSRDRHTTELRLAKFDFPEKRVRRSLASSRFEREERAKRGRKVRWWWPMSDSYTGLRYKDPQVLAALARAPARSPPYPLHRAITSNPLESGERPPPPPPSTYRLYSYTHMRSPRLFSPTPVLSPPSSSFASYLVSCPLPFLLQIGALVLLGPDARG